jgi:hypothetical protein
MVVAKRRSAHMYVYIIPLLGHVCETPHCKHGVMKN